MSNDFNRLLIDYPTEEEIPDRIILELGLLVLLLHIWILLEVLSPAESDIPPAQPFVMQISLVQVPATRPQAAIQVQAKSPRLESRQARLKPLVTHKQTISRKPGVFHPRKPAAETLASKPHPAAMAANDDNSLMRPTPVLPANQPPSPKPEPFTEANYDFNPTPIYPVAAQSKGWQGKVLLRVKVSATGISDDVSVYKSSGHVILDLSAIQAVKQWRFIPARRGELAVASSVIVPILFTSQN